MLFLIYLYKKLSFYSIIYERGINMKKENNNKVYINRLAIKNNKKMLIFYIALGLFIVLTILVKFHITKSFDNLMESFVIGIRSDGLTKFMTTITNISRAYFLITMSIVLLFILKNKKHALLIIINLTCVFLSSQLLKLIFHRGRPDGEFLVTVSGYSYPSGHAMVSLAYFAFILYLINQKITNKFTRAILTIITSILILLIGFSRVYLGVHYTTDIIAGFLLAIAYLMIFLTIVRPKEAK